MERCEECNRLEEICGTLIYWPDVDEKLCGDCMTELTTMCPRCGEREWQEDMLRGLCSVCQKKKNLNEPYDEKRDNQREEVKTCKN